MLEAFARTLRELRENDGLTQLELAMAERIDVGAISRWERGLSWPHNAHLEKLKKRWPKAFTQIAA